MTQPIARYADLSRLPGPTGPSTQRQMATLKSRLVARYNLAITPGRPEELTDASGRTVSVGYGCGTIRVRKHDGRAWADYIDLQVNDGWHAEVYAFLDGFFGYTPGATPAKLALTTQR